MYLLNVLLPYQFTLRCIVYLFPITLIYGLIVLRSLCNTFGTEKKWTPLVSEKVPLFFPFVEKKFSSFCFPLFVYQILVDFPYPCALCAVG